MSSAAQRSTIRLSLLERANQIPFFLGVDTKSNLSTTEKTK